MDDPPKLRSLHPSRAETGRPAAGRRRAKTQLWIVVRDGVDPSTYGFSDRQSLTFEVGRWAEQSVGAQIHWVQIDLGDDDKDHHIDDEERLWIAMARQ